MGSARAPTGRSPEHMFPLESNEMVAGDPVFSPPSPWGGPWSGRLQKESVDVWGRMSAARSQAGLPVGKSVGTTSPFILSAGRADEGRAEACELQEKRGASVSAPWLVFSDFGPFSVCQSARAVTRTTEATHISCWPVLEAGRWGPRCGQGWSLLRPLCSACRRPSPPHVLMWSSLCARVFPHLLL